MTLPVDDMRWCSWCKETRPYPRHDCAGGPDAPPCPNPETGQPCGICPADIAAQEADLGVTRTTPNGDPL